ncbi:hypothetical protein ACF0H5_008978 [Mactra antiquata]
MEECLSYKPVDLASVLSCLKNNNNSRDRSIEPPFLNETNGTSLSGINPSDDNLVQNIILIIAYGILCTVALFGNILSERECCAKTKRIKYQEGKSERSQLQTTSD